MLKSSHHAHVRFVPASKDIKFTSDDELSVSSSYAMRNFYHPYTRVSVEATTDLTYEFESHLDVTTQYTR